MADSSCCDSQQCPARLVFNLHSVDGAYGFSVGSGQNEHFVNWVYCNSPASRARLSMDDRIMEINSIRLTDVSHERVIEMILSAVGPLCLVVSRASYKPRHVLIQRQQTFPGFGFNVAGPEAKDENGEIGAPEWINGLRYEPLPFVSEVQDGSPAAKADLRVGDKLVEINFVCAEGVRHDRVVEMLNESDDVLQLKVLSAMVGGDIDETSAGNAGGGRLNTAFLSDSMELVARKSKSD